MPRFLVRALILFALCGPAFAESEQDPIEAELSRCMETDEGMSTAGMLQCLYAANAAWDAEMNRIWGELMRVLDSDSKAKLRSAQRQWIVFRDAEIQALDSVYGGMEGTMYLPMHADAVSNLTRDRVRELDALLEAKRSSVQ